MKHHDQGVSYIWPVLVVKSTNGCSGVMFLSVASKKRKGSADLQQFDGYEQLLDDIRQRIEDARIRAAVSANRELVLLYWNIGREILARQSAQGWGAKVIDRLSQDLRRSYPGMKGVSARNLKYMRAFAESWGEPEFVQEVLAQIPWYHHLALLEKTKSLEVRTWYARKCIDNGWSRNVLVHWIESGLYEREGTAQTNFKRTLPAPRSDLAQQLVKDPYRFDFLDIAEEANERDVEAGLVQHMRDFLLELGVGFAFIGNQYRLDIDDDEFFLDLLFYHTRLYCYVIVELKAGPFRPEYAGKLNFYCSAVDEKLRQKKDGPTIGLLLCRGRNRTVVEYTLRDINKPLGVSEYTTLPPKMQDKLPTIEQLEQELSRDNVHADMDDDAE